MVPSPRGLAKIDWSGQANQLVETATPCLPWRAGPWFTSDGHILDEDEAADLPIDCVQITYVVTRNADNPEPAPTPDPRR